MLWRQLLAGGLMLGTAGIADAGIFNRNKSKPAPAPKKAEAAKPPEANSEDRAGELVRDLRGDPDEKKRATAAAELAKVDFAANPQAGAALIESMQQDPSATVRAASATALGKLRPLTLQAGQALEATVGGDQSPRVRVVARNAFAAYLQAGYRTAGKSAPIDPRTNAPAPAPLEAPVAKRPTKPTRPMATASRSQSNEPPLADATPNEPRGIVIKPDPKQPPVVADEPSLLLPSNPATPTKPAKPDDDGPILNPPG